jgi:TM2 domain-containing membrane protein YozV
MTEPTMYPEMSLQEVNSKKVAAGVCGILLGSLGIHKFILGMNTAGLIMLLCTLLTCGLAGAVFHVIGLVEGILYLTKTDEEFYRVYIVGKKDWF